ncbi:uncharacterized protein CIMG_08023 [Coccidioides immitis RS]|uniref:Uncharacterized protein n=1 Tax=Coccidioides immitis (strain RS) TaxID=246410 RepID=J3K4M5_COCIM|nr:uncharacterized protein CIMG_08023 [Coccidioides immitis RS]EAS29277.3 hypothetical protein CIMG_08023 [Coccidioides immitis RS]
MKAINIVIFTGRNSLKAQFSDQTAARVTDFEKDTSDSVAEAWHTILGFLERGGRTLTLAATLLQENQAFGQQSHFCRDRDTICFEAIAGRLKVEVGKAGESERRLQGCPYSVDRIKHSPSTKLGYLRGRTGDIEGALHPSCGPEKSITKSTE